MTMRQLTILTLAAALLLTGAVQAHPEKTSSSSKTPAQDTACRETPTPCNTTLTKSTLSTIGEAAAKGAVGAAAGAGVGVTKGSANVQASASAGSKGALGAAVGQGAAHAMSRVQVSPKKPAPKTIEKVLKTSPPAPVKPLTITVQGSTNKQLSAPSKTKTTTR